MPLPVRIVPHGPADAGEPLISVDGAWGAPGLNLSHWPGNTTPADLRHDLSTGAALRFAALPRAERERRAAGATAIANNHYDTDGTCALWVLAHPDAAADAAEDLLAAAAAGDFYRLPSERAYALDRIVHGLADPVRSPLAAELAGLDDLARHQRATDFCVERLGEVLSGDLEPWRALFAPELEALRADLAGLARCARRDEPGLDATLWTAPADLAGFDPCRHALFGGTDADRVVVAAPREGGTTWRVVFGTRSWFDLETHRGPPRPDLAALAEELNELEGREPQEAVAWRAQSAAGASPELWFGTAELESFPDRNAALCASALPSDAVLGALAAALAVPAAPGRRA